MIHGPSESGKTQLMLTLAWSIANGLPFLYQFPSRPGRVLFVEVDTPIQLLQERLKASELFSPNIAVLTDEGGNFNIVGLAQRGQVLEDALADVELFAPDLVIFDALRDIHTMDERESLTARVVYGACRKVFPRAALLFIHHDRKRPTQGQRHRDEEASGTQAWRASVDTGMHLERRYDKERPFTHLAYLTFSKVRAAAKPTPIMLEMNEETLLFSPTNMTSRQHVITWLKAGEVVSRKEAVARLLSEKICARTMAFRVVSEVFDEQSTTPVDS